MPKYRKLVQSPSCRGQGIEIGMPREYSEHFLCTQMRDLMDEDALCDTKVIFKNGGACMRVSAFMLCLTSPVFQKMVCGGFKESVDKQLELEEVDENAFRTIMGLACGKDGLKIGDVQEVLELATLADRFQMPDVVAALEDVVLRLLTVNVCADVLSASTSCGLSRMMEAGRALALSRFEEVAKTEGFMGIGEDTLSSLLDDDRLAGGGEEIIFEALVRWMKAGRDGLRGKGLLSKIRFPLMDGSYLAIKARASLPEVESLKDLVMEACMIKVVPECERSNVELRHLCVKACVSRLGKGVAWDHYLQGGECRLNGHARAVNAMVACADRVCSGSEEGAIRVWNRATMKTERTLHTEGPAVPAIRSLLMWQGHVISGLSDGKVVVWDVATGQIDRRLHGHKDAVTSLAVWGSRLVSGSWDFTMRVWAMGTSSVWPCERTIEGHTDSVHVIAIWDGRILSGSEDTTIRVWDAATGAHEITLGAHMGMVTALVVHRDRLISSSWDGKIMAWRLGTWELLQTVLVYAPDSRQQVYRLIRSGCKLVSGSTDVNDQPDEYTQYEVRVWDLETLQCQHTLRQPAGAEVLSLLGVDGEVWAGVFNKIVVWGRE